MILLLRICISHSFYSDFFDSIDAQQTSLHRSRLTFAVIRSPRRCARAAWAARRGRIDLAVLALTTVSYLVGASTKVSFGCSRQTGCSGCGSTGYGRDAWMPWCWSSPQPKSSGTTRGTHLSVHRGLDDEIESRTELLSSSCRPAQTARGSSTNLR